jgi:hypothetical protein
VKWIQREAKKEANISNEFYTHTQKKHRLFCFFPVYPENIWAAKSWNRVYWVPSHARIEFQAFRPIEEQGQTYLCLMGANLRDSKCF